MSHYLIKHDVDLTAFNTFGFSQRAAHYVEVCSEEALRSAVAYAREHAWNVLAVGSGSNLILTRDYDGLVVRQTDHTIRYQERPGESPDNQSVTVVASAGLNWHELVTDTINRGLAGLENLALIPGTVGAAPVQNIGAYGIELSDRFISLRALHVPSLQWHTFNKTDCRFSYRNSIFKESEDQFIISSLTLELGSHWGLSTEYSALAAYLDKHRADQKHDAAMVCEAVCAIRRSKLPDPAKLPNAGSFFKNPAVSPEHFTRLKQRFPELVGYAQADGSYKLAAGWMIESLGYKGYRQHGVGVHAQQALVLIRYSRSTGTALLDLAAKIQQDVASRFDVQLDIEPRVI